MIDAGKPGNPMGDIMTIGIEEFKGAPLCRAEFIKDNVLWIYYYDQDLRLMWMVSEANGQRTEVQVTK